MSSRDHRAQVKGMTNIESSPRGANISVTYASEDSPWVFSRAMSTTCSSVSTNAEMSMAALAELDLARELTGHRRNRVFSYQRYLAIVGEGTEPL